MRNRFVGELVPLHQAVPSGFSHVSGHDCARSLPVKASTRLLRLHMEQPNSVLSPLQSGLRSQLRIFKPGQSLKFQLSLLCL